jgi:hypothetical protein
MNLPNKRLQACRTTPAGPVGALQKNELLADSESVGDSEEWEDVL